MTYTELLEDLQHKLGNPIDVVAVMVFLETSGLRDIDTVEQYQLDIFALATRLLEDCRANPITSPSSKIKSITLRQIVQDYLFELSFFSALFVQATALLLTGFSLSFHIDFLLQEISLIVGASVLAYIISGALSRAFYHITSQVQHEPSLVGELYFQFLGFSTIVYGIIYLCASWILYQVFLYTQTDTLVFLVYSFLISLSITSMSIWYVLRRPIPLFVISCTSLLIVALLMRETRHEIFLAHWIALAVFCFQNWFWVIVKLLWTQRKSQTIKNDIISFRKRLQTTIPDLWIGALYFLFIGLDRIVAYTNFNDNRIIQVNVEYELAHLWTLVPQVLGIALVNYLAGFIVDRVQSATQSYSIDYTQQLQQYVYRTYLIATASVLGLILMGSVLVYNLTFVVDNTFLSGLLRAMTGSSDIQLLFWLLTLASIFSSIGLLNSSLLSILQSRWRVAGIYAIVVFLQLILSIFLKVSLSYMWVVVAYLIISVLFWGSTTFYLWSISRPIGYTLYRIG
jgi:hypothetical protein